MHIWDSLVGRVQCRVVSASLSGFFSRITQLCDVDRLENKDDLTASFWVSRRDLPVISDIAQQRGDVLEVIKREGIFWSIKGVLKRPVLVIGLFAFLFLTVFLPTRVLFVFVDGNDTVPATQILDVAQKCGISFGAAREHVRSERIKNNLLQELPQLQWACVNTAGCVAVISVQERNPVDIDHTPGICDIDATRDGIVTEITVYRGTPLCRVGQVVKKGQTLISGYTDLGLVVKAGRAEGEIFAETQRSLTVITPTEYRTRQTNTRTENRYSLQLGKKLINFKKDSGISPPGCGRMYVERYATLPGGFRLPIAVVLERITYHEECPQQSDDFSWLHNAGVRIVQEDMIAGEILSKNVSLQPSDGVAMLYGAYRCREMIGYIQNEETFTDYGKRN